MSDEAISDVGETSATPTTPVEVVKDAGLHQMARADDASDFVAEKRDQKAEAEGVELSRDRKAAREDRYKRAFESAERHVAENRETSAPESATLVQAAGGDAGNSQETREEFEARIRDQTKIQTKFAMRADEYLKKNPSAKVDIAVLDFIEPASHVSNALLQSEYGPAMAHKLALNPDAIVELNAMPPMEAVRRLGELEGTLRAQESQSSEMQRGGGSRRATNAPAPMSTLRGGASPTPDLHELAKRSDDATPYVMERRRQNRASQR